MNRRHFTLGAVGFAAMLQTACTHTRQAAIPGGQFVIATAAPGGGFHPYGEAIVKLINARVPFKLITQSSTGSSANLQELNAGRIPFALTVMGPAWEAWNGVEAWTQGKTMRDFRALAPMYETLFHTMVPAGAPINTMRDLDGKRVAVGPAKGTGDLLFAGIAQALNITPIIVTGAPAQQAQDLAAGKLDAFFFGAGLRVPAFTTAAQAAAMRVIGFDDGAAAAGTKRFPYLTPATLAANTYPGQNATVSCLAVWNFIVSHRSVDDAVADAFVRALFDTQSALKAEIPSAEATAPRNAHANTFLPFHPGVAAFYRTQGVSVAALR
jgi:uncharacterized protein